MSNANDKDNNDNDVSAVASAVASAATVTTTTSIPILNRKRCNYLHMPAEKRLYRSSRNNSSSNHDDDKDDDNNNNSNHEKDHDDDNGSDNSTNDLTSLLALLHPSETTLTQNQNLLLDVPEEVLYKVTAYLTAFELLQLRSVNRLFHDLASRNQAGWDGLCQRLWMDKVHVCSEAKALTQNRMEAYRLSLSDALARNHLRLEELVYDTTSHTGTIWSFRFKESAGNDWTNMDPWYQGRPARKMVFLSDGTCQPYVPPVSALSGNTRDLPERDNPRVPTFLPPPNVHANANANANANATTGPILSTMAWRLITRPMDLPTRVTGSYIRITVGGRDVPTYAVQRSPVGNWGFVMESCWGLFASFELPARQPPDTITIPRNHWPPLHRHLRRARSGEARWVWDAPHDQEDDENNNEQGEEEEDNDDDDDDDDDNSDDNNDDHDQSNDDHSGDEENHRNGDQPADRWAVLRDDTHLLITNEVQWREAFLYNVGARVLPEGDEATGEFDRAWGGLGV